MKKLNLLVLLLLTWSSLAIAKTVSKDDARTIGYHFLSQKDASVKADALKLIYSAGTSQAAFYIFSTDHSFVMVSADDAVEPILAYSQDRAFRSGKIPAHIASFLENYTSQIDYAIANQLEAPAAVATQWHDLAAGTVSHNTASKTTAVAPLLHTTWDQSPYYNATCPYDAAYSDRAVTGCVATATAQVMKFWGWPTTGVGFHSYVHPSYGTLSANFGSTTYNWAAMPNNVTSSNPAVATLMSHVGISVDMQYGVGSTGGSGAYVTEGMSPITNCAEYALKTYFKYDAATTHGVQRDSYTESAWITMLEAEINAGRPVIYAGAGSAGGHCFVADGYDASNKMHINWGWSGYGPDGYYAVSALNPPSLGTGGGGGGFNSQQQAIIGIKPSGTIAPSSSLDLASYISLSAPSIFYSSAFSLTATIHNSGTTAFSGSYTAMVTNTSGVIVDSIQVMTGMTLAAGATSSLLTFSTAGSLSMVPGNYTVSIYAKSTGSSWAPVGSTSYLNSEPLEVYNHNYIQMASAMVPSPATFVQGSPASVNLNLQNDDFSDFSGNYVLALYNMDGTYSSTIQTMTGMTLPAYSMYAAPYLTFSTTNVTSPPGTYLLVAFFTIGSTNYLCGADYFQNPTFITVAAPPPSPDIYEVNNTAATAYTLPLTFVSNVATKTTTGSNFHTGTDQDYYKIVLPSGYDYSITARVNDEVSKDDAATYSVDAVWSYSTDNGATWSSTYSDVMSGGPITITGGTGGTVIFHTSASFSGNVGNYVLKLTNVTRTPATSITDIDLPKAHIFPNPATDIITVDLSGTGATATRAVVTDMQGREVSVTDVPEKSVFTIPVHSLAAGMYLVNITTGAGIINKKITIVK